MTHKVNQLIASYITLCALSFPVNASNNSSASDALVKKASHILKSNPEAALPPLKEAVIADPKNPKAYYMLGNVFMQLEQYYQAETEYRKAYELHPKDQYEIALARALLLQSRPNEVINIVKYEGLSPENTQLKLNILAKAYLIRGNHKDAISTLKKVLEIDPENSEALIEMTRNHILEKQFDDAQDTIAIVLKNEPDSVDATIMQGEIFLTMGAYKDAITAYNKALKIDPHHIDAFSGRARVALLQGQYGSALVDGRQILRQNTYHPMGRYIIASALFSSGRLDEAGNVYSVLSPNGKAANFPPSLLLQGMIKFHQQDYINAELFLKRYMYFHPDDIKAKQTLSMIKLKTQSYQQAIIHFGRLVAEHPHNIDARNGLASAYIRAQKYDDAQTVFEDIVRKFKTIDKTNYARNALKYFCNSSLSVLECGDEASKDVAHQMLSVIDMIYTEDISSAEVSLRHLQKIYPDNLDILALNAALSVQKNKIPDAYQNYLDIIAQNPSHEAALSGLLYLAQNSDLKNEIFKILEKIYKKSPSPNLGVRLAILAHNKGQTPYAENLLKDLYKQYPNDPDIPLALLTLYSTAETPQKQTENLILSSLNQFKNPIIQEQILTYAEGLEKPDFFVKALGIYHKSVKNPDPALLLKYGQVQTYLGHKKAARTIFKQIIRDNPSFEPAYKHLVQGYIHDKKFKTARHIVRKLDINSALKVILYAHIDFFSGAPQKAINRLFEAYNIYETHDLLAAIYDLYKIQGKNDRAIKLLIDHYKPQYDPHIDIGMVLGTYYLNTKNYVKAENILRPLASLPASTNNGDFLNNFSLARYYNAQDDALFFIESALKNDPNNIDYIKSYLVIATTHKHYDRVVNLAKKHRLTTPSNISDPSLLYALALSHAKTGYNNIARDFYNKLQSVKEDYFEKNKINNIREALQKT